MKARVRQVRTTLIIAAGLIVAGVALKLAFPDVPMIGWWPMPFLVWDLVDLFRAPPLDGRERP